MASTLQGRSLRGIDRSTLGALEAELRDLNLGGLAKSPTLSDAQRAAVSEARGNQNGVLFDEGGRDAPGWARNVLVQYGKASAGVGLSRRDEEAFIANVLGGLEAHWGEPVTTLPIDVIPKRGLELAIRKASMLQRLGRSPSDVTDFVIEAQGKVNGVQTRPQSVFGQRYRPDADKATGKVVVLSPGFQETGRSFEKQITEMLERGYDVVAMDHQWGGHSDGVEGSFDSAEGLARNLAAVSAYAQSIVDGEYGDRPDAEAILFGNSMGGMAALLAKSMNDHGKVELGPVGITTDADGAQPVAAQMPKGMKLMLQAPFLGLSDGVLNKALAFSGRMPMINALKLPSNGIAPKISSDRDVALLNAQATLLEHLSARPEAMREGLAGAELIQDFLTEHVPEGDIAIYHQRGDTLAKHSASLELAGYLRDRRGPEGVEMVSAPGVDHVVQNDPDVFKDPLDLLDRLSGGHAGRVNDGQPSPWHEQAVRELGDGVLGNLAHVSEQVGWCMENGPACKDVSGDFNAVLGAVKAGQAVLPDNASDFVYLHVPGLFTERYPGYMDGNLEQLGKRGLDARMAELDTDASVEVNAAAIKAQVEALADETGKQVVLLGHSKGGVDITAALGMYPELREHVRSVVTMQTPYGGTPVASDIESCPELFGVVKGFIRSMFKGDERALTDLSYGARQQFLAKYPYPADVPTLSLATSSDSPFSLTAASALYMLHQHGAKSDGLVALDDAKIPGARLIELEDMDHAGAAMPSPGWDPGQLAEALVAMALRD